MRVYEPKGKRDADRQGRDAVRPEGEREVTTYTCPDGHASSTGDYCDVCGVPIPSGTAAPSAAGPGTVTPAPPAPPAPGFGGGSALDLDAPAPRPVPGSAGLPTAPAPVDQLCPNCGAANLPDALYCEDCGYDFTTGQLPRPLEPREGPPPRVPDTGVVPLGASGPGPAAGDAGDAEAAASAGASTAASAALGGGEAPGGGGTGGQLLAPPVTPTSAPGHVEWVAEVWIDPDWYAAQDVSEPCPSPGMPWVIPILERTVLIGRVSASRNIHPQIDISTDSGVSRRHAQLTSDGQRWWVEDLQSANGTYVGAAGSPSPTTPITPGQRVELAEDDRIYLGAWSRVVVRRATPEESTLGS